jgi:radical SAM protein with 4Fe4S-binding SPASM domain
MGLLRNLYVNANQTLLRMPKPMRNAAIAMVANLPFSLRYPRVFMIEPTNACNGLCPLCPVGAQIDTRRKGQMRYSDFVRLVDEIRGFASSIVMNFAGEPLINPQIAKMAAYAEASGIRTVIGTNGTLDKSDALVRAGVSEILFSLDGVTEHSYRQYRTYRDGSDHTQVMDNLRRLVAKKRQLKTDKPRIILQFVLFRHNQHELADIIALGRSIGVDAIDIKPVCINDFFALPQDQLMAKFAPQGQSGELGVAGASGSKPPWCAFSFYQTQILWNGDVTSCCYDYDGNHSIGNVFTDGGFRAVWRSRRYRKVRRQIVGQSLDICRSCDERILRPERIRLDGNDQRPQVIIG